MKVIERAVLAVFTALTVMAVSDIELFAQDLTNAKTVEFDKRNYDAGSVTASQKETELKRAIESGRTPETAAVSSTGETGMDAAEHSAINDEEVIFGTTPMQENGDWGMDLPRYTTGL